jgi:hypothetical protein
MLQRKNKEYDFLHHGDSLYHKKMKIASAVETFLYSSAESFLHGFARHHNLMPAAHTFQTEIHADTKDFPMVLAAWMGFLHFYMLTD